MNKNIIDNCRKLTKGFEQEKIRLQDKYGRVSVGTVTIFFIS